MAFAVTSGGLSSISSGIGDLFDKSDRYRAKGSRIEAASLRKAAGFAREASDITEESTKLQVLQQQRKVTQTIGQNQAAIAASGFANSGSALDILADSFSQGELERGVIEKQGLLTSMGYDEQARSLDEQAKVADLAAQAAAKAGKTKGIMGAVKIAAGAASMFT